MNLRYPLTTHNIGNPRRDMHDQTVTIRSHGKTEVLNLVCETENSDGSNNQLTTESESDIGEDSGKGNHSAFVLTLKKDRFPRTEIEKST